jgi:Peptidase A4 family
MTATTTFPHELGITLPDDPPAGFDPLTARNHELIRYGFPARPDKDVTPKMHERWQHEVTRTRTRVQPIFVVNPDKVHGPARRPVGVTGEAATDNATSTNWSGSASFVSAGDSVTWVEGAWIVPDPADPKGGKSAYYSSAWVGIDGWNSPDVLQAGTESEFVGGTKRVYAWWEWYPNFEVSISNFPVSPGDTMYCLICVSSSTTATIYLTNDNTDQTMSFSITAPSGTSLVGNCAEWIVETPSVGGSPTTLPDYGTVFFDEAYGYTKNKANVDGFTGTPITLVDSAGKALSTPTLEKSQLIKLTYNDLS